MSTGFELINGAYAIMASCPTDEELAADPEAEEAWTERMLAWCDASEQKAEAYRAVVTAATSREGTFKALAAAYAKQAKREARVVERVESLAVLLLRATELTTGAAEAECSDGTRIVLKVQKSKRVEVLDQDAVPDVYLRRPPPAVDKAAAAAVLRGGEGIPGLELKEHSKDVVSWGL